VSRLLAGYVGVSEFKEKYGDANDPRYQKALQEFRESGESHVAAYNDFPKLEAWVEGGFSSHYFAAERGRIRARLLHEGTSSDEFEKWFLEQKAPQLKEQARKSPSTVIPSPSPSGGKGANGEGSAAAALQQAAASDTAQQLLARVRSNPALLADFREQWLQS